ncbi:MAG: glycoside hydrolase family 18 protein [Eubacteriales bacterium]|nr:glycoside hydrolase family 18 protein [Eubacteriales bacterium]
MGKLIGYVGTKEINDMMEEDIKAMDVVNIAFGRIADGRAVWSHPECKEGIARIRRINPEQKILLSVGGWGAGGFSEAARTPEGRAQFAATAMSIVKEYGLDGIDIDWEYPCFTTAGIGACKADKENYTLFLKAIRETMEEEEKGRYMLTIAAGGDSYFVKNTQMDLVQEYLDYVQIMTYDLRGGFQTLTGHHTNLYSYQTDLFDASADKAVRAFHEAGVPREKIVIGAAFYCREWKGVEDVNHGLCQQAKTTGTITHHYGELAENYINKNGYVRYWDEEAKAPYLFNGSNFISYDDEESLSCKIAYLKEQKLSGIMFWAYDGEKTHTLVTHIRKELDQ